MTGDAAARTREVRFLFDRRFDPGAERKPMCAKAPAKETPPPAPPAAAPQPPQPRFTSEDLDQARAEGRKAGRAEAATGAVDAVNRRMADALEAINAGVRKAIAQARQSDAERAREATVLARAMIAKLFPEASRQHGLGEILHVLDTVLPRLSSVPTLTVRVSEHMAQSVRERLAGILEAPEFGGDVHIVGDPAVADGDCRIVWHGGGAVRDGEALRRQIDALCCAACGVSDDQPPDASSALEEPAEPVAAGAIEPAALSLEADNDLPDPAPPAHTEALGDPS